MIYYRTNELYHHGIKGQKWGVRRWQNADGTFNEAGKKRYFNADGTLNKRGQKAQAKAEYKAARREISKRYEETNRKFDKRKTENIWGFESGGVGTRAKNHIKNEYNREKALNKLDQEKLDAKRAYRQKIGKKKVDTLMMKISQKGIDSISDQTLSEFTKDYVLNIGSQVVNAASSYYNNREQQK